MSLSQLPPRSERSAATGALYYRRLAPLLLLAWISFVIWATISALQAHISILDSSYPAIGASLMPLALGLLGVAAFYALWIRKFVWRHEPLLVALGLLAPIAAMEPRAAIVVCSILAAAFALGSFTTSSLGLVLPSGAARLSFGMTVGLGVMCMLLFALGLLQLYTPWILGSLLAAAAALGWRRIWSGRRDLVSMGTAWRRCLPLARPWVGFCVFFSVLFAACAEAIILAPTIAYDSIYFHLPLIKSYSIVGGLIEYPQLREGYGYNPQNFEVLLTLAHVLGGTRAAQLTAGIFVVLALLVATAICRLARFSKPSIVLGLAAVASMPMMVWCAGVMKNDIAMVCFQLAAIYACLRSVHDKALGWLLASGLLLGCSFGVKPTALFAAVPIGLFWVYDCWRRPNRLRSLALTGLCFASAAFLWPARTYVLTGSPFYSESPMRAFDALDPGDSNGLRNHIGRFVDIAVQAHIRGDEGVFELPIKSPIGVTTAILVGGLLLWTRRRKGAVAGRARLIAFGALLYWMSTMRTARYGITPIMLTPLLLAPNFLVMFRLLRPSLRVVAMGALLYSFLFSVLPTLIISNSRPQLLNLAGQLSDEDYVAESSKNLRAFHALYGLASQEDKVLLVGACEAGFAPFPWKVTCCKVMGPECPAEKMHELASAYQFVMLSKRVDPAVLGAGWSVAAAPEHTRSIVYAANPRPQDGRHE